MRCTRRIWLVVALCGIALPMVPQPAAAATRTFGARISTAPPNRFSGTLFLPREVTLEGTTVTVVLNREEGRHGATATIGPTVTDPTTGGSTAAIEGEAFLVPGAPTFPAEGPHEVTVSVGAAISTMTVGVLISTTAPSGSEPGRIDGEIFLPRGWVITSSPTEPAVNVQAVLTRGETAQGAAVTVSPTTPNGRTLFSGKLYGAAIPTAGPVGATLTLYLPVEASP